MQFAQLRAGLQARVLDQGVASGRERGERLGLAPCPVQLQHSLGVQALPQRVLGDQPLQLSEDLAARGHVGVDRELGRPQAQLVQAPDLGRRERLGRDVGQRRSAPDRQRPPGGIVAVLVLGRATHELLEARRIDRLGIEAERIAAAVRLDLRARPGQDPPQPRDIQLHHLGGGGGRRLAP